MWLLNLATFYTQRTGKWKDAVERFQLVFLLNNGEVYRNDRIHLN